MSAAEEIVDQGEGDDGQSVVEGKALAMGWLPKEQFKGDTEKWVDASTFLERGEHFLPMLKKRNERQDAQIRTLSAKVEQLTATLEAAGKDLENYQQFHVEEVNRRVDQAKKELIAQIKQARSEGNEDVEIDLTARLAGLQSAQDEAKDKSSEEEGQKGKAAPKRPEYDPNLDEPLQEWIAANPWYGGKSPEDVRRSYEVMGIGQAIKMEHPTLVGKAFYAELDKRLAGESRPVRSKVESSRGGTTGAKASGRGYSNLPAEAKQVCDANAERFVNPNGKYKTAAEYRKHFVKQLEDTGYTDWI